MTGIENTYYSSSSEVTRNIDDALRKLVPFVQVKNRKNNHGWVLLKVTLLHGSFSLFLKLCKKWYQIVQNITYAKPGGEILEKCMSAFSLDCAKNVILHTFLKEPPRKYLNFTIKENMRGERVKDETFRNALSYYLITSNLKLKLGAGQEELFYLEFGWNIPNSVVREL